MASKQNNGKQTRQGQKRIAGKGDKVQTKIYKQQNEIQEKNNNRLHYYYKTGQKWTKQKKIVNYITKGNNSNNRR